MRLQRTLLILTMGSLLVAPVFGQGQQTGDLQGTVQTEGSDDGLPGVKVTVKSAALQGERVALTGATGSYLLRGLPPGEYSVLFELDGMRTVERTVTVNVGLQARVDADMTVSDVVETLVVIGEAPSALENPTIGANLDKETVDQLPIGRTILGIGALSPNVTENTAGPGGQLAIAGGMGRDNVWMVNGVDVTDPVFSNPINVYIEDAILETQTLTSGISAEYGRFGGGVINAITKSGGNEFAGSLRVGLQNPEWRDETPLEDEREIEREGDTNETYEATLGGYFWRDRIWFFLAGRDEKTQDQRNLSLSNLAFTEELEDERLEGKLTVNLTQNHNLQITYAERDTTDFGTSTVAGSTVSTVITRTLPNELAVGRYNGVLTSSLFVEAQYSERKFGFRDAGGTNTDLVTGTPIRCWNLATDCHYNAPYFDATDPEDRDNEQASASLSYFLDSTGAGTHDLKFGFEQFTNINVGGNSQSPTDWVLFQDPLLDAAGNPVYRADGSEDFVPLWNNWQFGPFVGGSPSDGVPGVGLGVFFEAVRGAELEIQTDSYFLNDRWQLNDHWSFNLGVRYEENSSKTNAGVPPVDTDNIVPRLAVAYDLKGDGKYRLDATYGEYVSSYNLSEFSVVTNVGNPSYLFGYYVGPGGTGINFAPAFDRDNYFIVGGAVPTENVFFEDGLSSNETREWTLSGGMQLPKGGHLKLSYIDREFTNFVEDTITIENGQTETSIGQVLDNRLYINTSVPERTYQAGVLQGRYNLTPRWSVQGHWTHLFEHDGNYVGEDGQSSAFQSSVGDYPEILDERNFPVGRLPTFEDDRVRLWSIYQLPLGRAGDFAFSLLWNYDSGFVYSFAENADLSSEQQAILADVGYAGQPAQPGLFYGGRGTEEFNGWNTFDFSVLYNLPIFKQLELFVKGDVFNVFNEDTLIGFDTSITGDADGPLDALGRPTTFTKDTNFGNPRSDADYVVPMEYRFAIGIRF